MSTSCWLVWIVLSLVALGCSPTVSQQQNSTFLRPSEAYAMRHLRYSLRIRDFYWPKAKNPCGNWRGVLCENASVVSIYLSGLRRTLAGMAQPTLVLDNLRGLPSLRLLNATGFVMLGTIPDWIGQLTALQVLDFSACSINGTIPPSVGQLPALQRLSLAGNQLAGGIPDFSGAAQLAWLDLSGNSLSGSVPRNLGSLPKLQQLDLSSNSLSGGIPPELGNSSSLSVIHLEANDLSAPIPSQLGRLSSLRTLSLSSNRLNGSIPSTFSSLHNVTTLNLSFNNLTDYLPPGLTNMTSLVSLNLSSNLFYGPLLEGLVSLKGLAVLDVSSNFFNSSVPSGFLSVANAVLVQNCLLRVMQQRPLSVCESFYAARKLFFSGNDSSSDKPTPMLFPKKKNSHRAAILGGVLGGIGALLLILLIIGLVAFIWKCERRRRRSSTSKQPEGAGPADVAAATPTVQGSGAGQTLPPGAIALKMSSIGDSFTLAEIRRATQDFDRSNMIKAGHSGDLYRGVLDGGAQVVVKRIQVAKMKKDLLSAELQVFGKASHTRLVPLLGHCLEDEEEKFLVYKYMPNGDAAQALRKKVQPTPPGEVLQSLDWITRLKIATGAAEALNFLHHECVPPLVHRDIQASSILLDDKFEVRLGSLSETRPQEGESQPGLITRILRLSQTTDQAEQGVPVAACSYDVYCFGKFLLELVSGKLDISSPSEDPNADAWLDWALGLIDRHNKDAIVKLVDPSLIVDEDLLEEVWAMAIVAKLCLNTRPAKRPQIRHVLRALENPQRVTREENFGSSLRSRTSSHSSLFGSWRHSSSENVIAPGAVREEYVVDPNRKHSGTSHSQGSLPGEQSFHKRPGSNEIFPEPVEDTARPPASLSSGDKFQAPQQQQQQQQMQR